MHISKKEIVVLGGGILGTTLAYWLSQRLKSAKIFVVEKEEDVAGHMSGRNTGVIHRPFYLDPSRKAKIAKAAENSYYFWKEFAQNKNLPWRDCGTVEVAIDEASIEDLHKYKRWSLENGMSESEIEIWDRDKLCRQEPAVNAPGALFCKTDVSVDFAAFARALMDEAEDGGVKFLFNFDVANIETDASGVKLLAVDGREIGAEFLINCAGGNAIKFAHMVGVGREYADLNFRGEYFLVESKYNNLTRSNIYSVPRVKKFPFLDPHWVVKSDGTVVIGPNAVPVLGPYVYEGFSKDLKSGFSKLNESPRMNKLRLLSNPEFLGLVWSEWKSSLTKGGMVARLKQFMPEVEVDFLADKGPAGVRSSLIDRKGNFLPEVIELVGENSLHILNYNSPGATGAPMYTKWVVDNLICNNLL